MTHDDILALAESGEATEEQALGIVQGRDSLEWAMGVLAEGEAEKARIVAAANEARARIAAREAELLAKVDHSTAFLRGAVEGYARSHRKELIPGRPKTVSLIHGEIAYRITAERLEVEDEGAAMDWARSQPVESDMVRVKTEINKRALSEHFKRTGEIPPGCAVIPASESIHIKPEQPEVLDIAPSRKEIAS